MIETQRLILRQWQAEDAEAFADLCADPEVMRFFPSTLTRPEVDSLITRFSQHIEQRTYGFFAAELKASAACIGFIGLNYTGDGLPFAPCNDIGWRLQKAAWGRGLATEGAKAVLEYGFTSLDIAEIVSMTPLSNRASERVMQKIGLVKHDQTFLHPKLPKGHRLERHLLYTLTQEQWRANQTGAPKTVTDGCI